MSKKHVNTLPVLEVVAPDVTPVTPVTTPVVTPVNTTPVKPISKAALKANITVFKDAQRTEVLATFNSFVEAKRWLSVVSGKTVTNVGNSLEKASETGKPSRGYYWLVSNIAK